MGIMMIFGAMSVFGIGVTLIDMLGLIGHGHDDGDADSSDDQGMPDHQTALHLGFDHSKEPEPVISHHHDSKSEPVDTVEVPKRADRLPVEKILFVLRSAVYFSLGCGPTGFFLMIMLRNLWIVLPASIAAGLAAFFMAFMIRKLQTKTIDSQFDKNDLIMAEGQVLIKIDPGKMGKIRIKMTDYFTDRFARADSPSESIPADTKVRVVRVTDDILYVTAEKNIIENN